MWSYVIPVLVLAVIALLLLPMIIRNDTQPERCTCKNYNWFSMDIDYDCPLHGDWR